MKPRLTLRVDAKRLAEGLRQYGLGVLWGGGIRPENPRPSEESNGRGVRLSRRVHAAVNSAMIFA